MVVARDEWHLGHHRGGALSARLHLNLGSRLGVSLAHVSHGDVFAEHGGETTAGDVADLLVADEDLASAARRRALPGEAQTDAAARHALRQLFLDGLAADEVARVAARLTDRPRQTSLERCDGLVEIVAVEAQASFESKGIAGAEAAHARRGFSSSFFVSATVSVLRREISKPSSPV